MGRLQGTQRKREARTKGEEVGNKVDRLWKLDLGLAYIFEFKCMTGQKHGVQGVAWIERIEYSDEEPSESD